MDNKSKDLLLNTQHIIDFVSYYNQRNNRQSKYINTKSFSTITFNDMEYLILNFISDTFSFSYPKLNKINKMKAKKNRDIFIFPCEEQLLLKYINFVLTDGIVSMHPQCFSFQRGKPIKLAIKYIRKAPIEGLACIKIDITNYFNSIPINQENEWLTKPLHEYPTLSSRIQHFLCENKVIYNHSVIQMQSKGVMAGMPLSPFLSNLYLREFDHQMALDFVAYARYSDDMVFFCKEDEVERRLNEIVSILNGYGLAINETKTKIFGPNEPFDFLGLKFDGDKIDLSDGTILKMKGKIKRATRSLYRWQQKNNVPYEKSVMVLIRKFNRKFYGYEANETDFTWSKWFFGLITQTDGLKIIDAYFQETIRYLASGSYKKTNYQRIPYNMLKAYGYKPLVAEYYRHH